MIISKLSQIYDALNQDFPEIKEDSYYISVFVTGHDQVISISKGKKVLEVIELERFLNDKHSSLGRIPNKKEAELYSDSDFTSKYKDKTISLLYEVKDYISKKYTDKFDAGIFTDSPFHHIFSRIKYPNQNATDIRKIFNVDKWYLGSHHLSHATCSFYQSPFKESLVVTFDGGSKDGTLNLFYFKGNEVKHITEIENPICDSYTKLGLIFKDIKRPTRLEMIPSVYPGKIMGLSAYGQASELHKNLLKEYLYPREGNITREDVEKKLLRYGINVKFCRSEYRSKVSHEELQRSLLEGKEEFNFAASLQLAFEEKFMELIGPYLDEYKNIPLCLSGGGALNILANTRMYEKYDKLPFIPPDPNDSGLSLGALLYLIKPDERYENPYSGIELLDRNLLSTYIFERYLSVESNDYLVKNVRGDRKAIASLLNEGNIIGVARGRAERGPRALGNRSILASASIPGMKDKINRNVKGREWFRPFAPVVRLKDVSKYFEWEHESRYMSFSPLVKEEYRKTLESITHVDGTSRVQTVTEDQNEFIHDLLTELENECGIGVMLNTSFNVDSKPIVSSIKDCLKVLEETDLDGVLIDDTLIIKNYD